MMSHEKGMHLHKTQITRSDTKAKKNYGTLKKATFFKRYI
uniref:Uncharacterized protein n=1 Tax=Ciona intestinalis TaxID=7719 RepID=H2Y098_CIOIN